MVYTLLGKATRDIVKIHTTPRNLIIIVFFFIFTHYDNMQDGHASEKLYFCCLAPFNNFPNQFLKFLVSSH